MADIKSYPIPDPIGLTCAYCGRTDLDAEVRMVIFAPTCICDICVRNLCEILLLHGISLAEEIERER